MADVVTYEIDAGDVISGVGGRWGEFARDNNGAHLVSGVVGRSLWDFVGGSTTRHMYSMLAGRVREGQPVSFVYRCDSPASRRYMRMRMLPTDNGGVRFESETLMTRAWPEGLLATRPDGRSEFLRVCSWCKKGLVDNRWEEPEVVVEWFGMFIGDTERPISHAICPSCAATIEAAIAAARRSRLD
jgi:hypothetical protein